MLHASCPTPCVPRRVSTPTSVDSANRGLTLGGTLASVLQGALGGGATSGTPTATATAAPYVTDYEGPPEAGSGAPASSTASTASPASGSGSGRVAGSPSPSPSSSGGVLESLLESRPPKVVVVPVILGRRMLSAAEGSGGHGGPQGSGAGHTGAGPQGSTREGDRIQREGHVRGGAVGVEGSVRECQEPHRRVASWGRATARRDPDMLMGTRRQRLWSQAWGVKDVEWVG